MHLNRNMSYILVLNMCHVFVFSIGSEPKPTLGYPVLPFVDIKPLCLFVNFFFWSMWCVPVSHGY